MNKTLKFVFAGVVVVGLIYGIWATTDHADGLLHSHQSALKAETVEFEGHSFDLVHIDPEKSELRLFWKDDNGNEYGSFEKLREDMERKGKKLLFATNAGIFSEDHTPGGLHIEDGRVLKNLNLRDGAGNFHLKPNGVFMLGAEGADVVESGQFKHNESDTKLATQSGPMLVIDGQIHPAFRPDSDNLFIRNGVGVDSKGKVHFAISNDRVNFFSFASLFRDYLKCPDALYLDGSISGFYLPDHGRTDNGAEFCGILAVVD